MHKKYRTRIGSAMEEFLALQKEKGFCAADVCHYLEIQEISANVTTVYRHLEQLVKDGILVKFKTADSDNQRYRLAGDVTRCHEHLHLQCCRCGRIQHLQCGFMEEIDRILKEEYGFTLDCETSTLSGICLECRRKQKEEDT